MDEPNGERDRSKKKPKANSVFFEHINFIESEESRFVDKDKTTQEFLHSQWELWYEEIVAEGKEKIMFYAKQTGLIFSSRHQISVEINEERMKEFETDKPEETYAVPIDLPKDTKLEDMWEDSVLCRIKVHPTNFISPEYHCSNNFLNKDRPHDVVLKFADNFIIYGNKVMLALWSNYFDRLFFSSEESEKIDEFTIDDVDGDAFDDLLDICLNRKYEFHKLEGLFRLDHIEAAFKLEMNVPMKFFGKGGDFNISRRFRDVANGIYWSDFLNNPNLRKRCERIYDEFSESEQKRLFAEQEDKLAIISDNVLSRLWNKWFRTLPEIHLPEVKFRSFETGVNIRQDVCLLVGDERFEVHKEYLAFWSPYFDRLFFGDFIEKEMTEMEIKEVYPQEFGTLLRLIYPPGDVKIDDSNVAFLLKLADRFEIKSVMIMCCSYITEKVTGNESHEDLIDLFEMADKYSLVDVQILCFDQMYKMDPDVLLKFIEDNNIRLANFTENTRKNIILRF